jgi:Lon protease-like protein
MAHVSDARLERIPVFPLSEVYLFPGTLLPLHIFEPRYVQMLQHCMQQDRAIAIASIDPSARHRDPPGLRPIMGVGLILAARETEQKTWNIIVRGLDRAALTVEHPQTHLFREVAVQRLIDAPRVPGDPRYPRLRMLLAQVAARAEATRKALDLMLEQAADADALVHLIGAHLIGDADVRRRLLETCDGGARLDIACAHIARLLLDIGTRSETTLH